MSLISFKLDWNSTQSLIDMQESNINSFLAGKTLNNITLSRESVVLDYESQPSINKLVKVFKAGDSSVVGDIIDFLNTNGKQNEGLHGLPNGTIILLYS